MNPFVFIVGCPRSGTTVLQRVVNAHPRLTIINQSRWIPGLYRMVSRAASDGQVTADLIPRFLDYHGLFQKMGISREDLQRLLRPGPMSYAHFVTGIFDLYGHAQGKPVVGDKTPIYVRQIAMLHELWPEARFVHLIRDGRNVALSTVNWKKNAAWLTNAFATWRDDPVTTAAMRWRWNVQLGREAGMPLGPRSYYELRYEALVTRPAEECGRLCTFLGVPYDDAMLRFHEGRTKDNPNLDAKKSWRPITPGLRDWRTQMAAEDVERFEASAGDLLDELGYPRGVPQPRSESLLQASRIREQFIRDLRSRNKLVPAQW
jgi:hypothetical protein